MKDFEKIKAATNSDVVNCSCGTCKKMCRTECCIGTPEDIVKIAEAGYVDNLSISQYAVGVYYGELPMIQMIQPKFLRDKGRCSFLNDDGLCMLHDIGLKPTEGKLADCKSGPTPYNESANYHTAVTWLDDKNVKHIFKLITIITSSYVGR
jgi:hypothetical protein